MILGIVNMLGRGICISRIYESFICTVLTYTPYKLFALNQPMWIAGLREGVLYKVAERPLDPRWSQADLQILLGLCATGQHLGWTEERAFQAAEALVYKKKLNPIWRNDELTNDMSQLTHLLETA